MAEINKSNKFQHDVSLSREWGADLRMVLCGDAPIAMIQATWSQECQVLGHLGDSEKSWLYEFDMSFGVLRIN